MVSSVMVSAYFYHVPSADPILDAVDSLIIAAQHSCLGGRTYPGMAPDRAAGMRRDAAGGKRPWKANLNVMFGHLLANCASNPHRGRFPGLGCQGTGDYTTADPGRGWVLNPC